MSNAVVSFQTLKPLCSKKLQGAGVPQNHADVVAEILVHADARGISSHGVLRTEHYVNRIEAGGLNIRPQFSFKQTGMVTAIFDGNNGLGHVVMKNAMENAIEMAKEKGVGMVGVVKSSHCGALSYFVKLAAEVGFIGMAVTHTDSWVVPFGGSKPFFGTNPIAFSFPTNKHKPIILDMATSNVALGKVLYAKETGRDIPLDWGVDDKGTPTSNPANVVALLPFGGPKGYGLGMVVDILSGILTGSAFGPHVVPMYGDYDKMRELGHFLCVINPAMFTEPTRFKNDIDQMIDEIHEMAPAEGVDRVLVPGEPEQLREEKSLRDGILVPQSVYTYLIN